MRGMNRIHRLWLIVMTLIAVLGVMTGGLAGGTAVAQDGTSGATPSSNESLQTAVEWLISQQTSDGGFPGQEGTADPGMTIDALISLAAARQAGVDTGTSIDDAVAYLGSGEIALIYIQSGVGQAAKLVLALAAARENVDDFAGVSPLAIVENSQDPETGFYGDTVYDHALSLLALDAAGLDVPSSAIDAITETQTENGGWGFDGATDPTAADSNTTSIVIQALVAVEADAGQLIADGFAYLKETLSDDGAAAFNDDPESVPDANSTALVAQALIAAGSNADPQLEALTEFQNASGAFFYTEEDTSDNLFATIQAIVPLAGAALPVIPAS